MAKKKQIFFCTECGAESARWLGKCPYCQSWNTYVEHVVKEEKKGKQTALFNTETLVPVSLNEIQIQDTVRMKTGSEELDRVLGGGMVPGSLVLLGGDPGIGKSTMVMQMSGHIAKEAGSVLYASGEESSLQLKMRADRLGVGGENVSIFSATDMDAVLEEAERIQPALLVVDSIQTMYTHDLEMAAGSVGQVRECTSRLLRFAKEKQVSVIVIGHMTKDGNIAGPRMLEHMVDVVLYFEGERSYPFRVLRSIKNRFGSTLESGLFSMEEEGLCELLNPSELLLAERSSEEAGSATFAHLEGVRPVLVEAQSLVSTTPFGLPRRTAIGYDMNRLLLILAVLEKKVGISLSNKDVYVNIIGGLKIAEPASDLAIAVAIVSALKERIVPPDVIVMGEIGLTGQVRSIPHVEIRIAEAEKLGFKKCIVPSSNVKRIKNMSKDMQIIGVKSIKEAIEQAF